MTREFLTYVYKTLQYFGYTVELQSAVEVKEEVINRIIPLALIVDGVILEFEPMEDLLYLAIHHENKPVRRLYFTSERERSIPQLYFWLGMIIKEEIG